MQKSHTRTVRTTTTRRLRKVRIKDQIRSHQINKQLSDTPSFSRSTGLSYKIHCRKESLDATEETVVVDENQLAKGHEYTDVQTISTSPSHSMVAYACDYSGYETYSLYVKTVAGDVDAPLVDEIADTSGDVEWGNDDSTFFYLVMDEEHRPYKVGYHPYSLSSSLIHHCYISIPLYTCYCILILLPYTCPTYTLYIQSSLYTFLTHTPCILHTLLFSSICTCWEHRRATTSASIQVFIHTIHTIHTLHTRYTLSPLIHTIPHYTHSYRKFELDMHHATDIRTRSQCSSSF